MSYLLLSRSPSTSEQRLLVSSSMTFSSNTFFLILPDWTLTSIFVRMKKKCLLSDLFISCAKWRSLLENLVHVTMRNASYVSNCTSLQYVFRSGFWMSPIPGKSQNIIWEFLGCGYAVGTVVVLFSSPTSAAPSSSSNSYLEKSLMNLDIQNVRLWLYGEKYVVLGRRVTRLPELPWASQRFMYFLAKRLHEKK